MPIRPGISYASWTGRWQGASILWTIRLASLDDPRNIGEALKGARLGTFWKYRVGDYRVIASIEDGAVRILVVRVGNRREVYR